MSDRHYSGEIEKAMQNFFTLLSERDKRLYAAVEAAKLGQGGIGYVASLLRCSERTIRRGLVELRNPDSIATQRVRKKGAGERVACRV